MFSSYIVTASPLLLAGMAVPWYRVINHRGHISLRTPLRVRPSVKMLLCPRLLPPTIHFNDAA
jgi:hypothetical protein